MSRSFDELKQKIIAVGFQPDSELLEALSQLVKADMSKFTRFLRQLFLGEIENAGLENGEPWQEGLCAAVIRTVTGSPAAAVLTALTDILATLSASDEVFWEDEPFKALEDLCLTIRDSRVLPIIEFLTKHATLTPSSTAIRQLAFLYFDLDPAKARSYCDEHIRDRNDRRKAFALAILAKIGDSEAVARLRELATVQNVEIAAAALGALTSMAPQHALDLVQSFLEPSREDRWNPRWDAGAAALAGLSDPVRSSLFTKHIVEALRVKDLKLIRALFEPAIAARVDFSVTEAEELLGESTASPWSTNLYILTLLLAKPTALLNSDAKINALFGGLAVMPRGDSYDYRDLHVGLYVLGRRMSSQHPQNERFLRYLRFLHTHTDTTWVEAFKKGVKQGYVRDFYDIAILLLRERTGERVLSQFDDEPKFGALCDSLALDQA